MLKISLGGVAFELVNNGALMMKIVSNNACRVAITEGSDSTNLDDHLWITFPAEGAMHYDSIEDGTFCLIVQETADFSHLQHTNAKNEVRRRYALPEEDKLREVIISEATMYIVIDGGEITQVSDVLPEPEDGD